MAFRDKSAASSRMMRLFAVYGCPITHVRQWNNAVSYHTQDGLIVGIEAPEWS